MNNMNFFPFSLPVLPKKSLSIAMLYILGVSSLSAPAYAVTKKTQKSASSATARKADTAPATAVAPANDRIVAVVNDTPILQSQWQLAIYQAVQQLKSQNLPIPPAEKLYPQVLDQLVVQQAQLDFIKRTGYKPDDAQVDAALLNIARQQGITSLPAFQQSLDAQQKGGYQLVRQQVINSISLKALQQQQVLRRAKITDQEADLFLKSPEGQALKQSQYRTVHIRVPFQTATPSPKDEQRALATARQIAQNLQGEKVDIANVVATAQKTYPAQIVGGDMGFHTLNELPAGLSSTITALQAGQVTRPIRTAEGYNVLKLIAKQDSGQKIISQWSVRHILVSPSATRSPAMAKQQIEAIYEQLRKGADFATLASTYSDDPGSAKKGGALGWVSEGEMVPEFEKTMKNTSVSDYSAPFQSQFGWHILKVDAVRQQDVTDTYLRHQAKEVLFQRAVPQALEDWLQEVRSQSYIKIMDN